MKYNEVEILGGGLILMSYTLTDLSPIIKWAGGKEQELKYILPNLPANISRFIEPFVGGGAVYFSINSNKKLINDKSMELINLYNDVKYKNTEFTLKLQNLQNSWLKLEDFLNFNLSFFKEVYFKYKKAKINKAKLEKEIRSFLNNNNKEIKNLTNMELCNHIDIFEKELFRNITNKLVRMKELELQNGDLSEIDIINNFECALKGSFYMFIRVLYNQNQFENSHYFYFIREYCYSSMFRYNSDGEFNVPYGGISYNRKNFQKKIDYIKSKQLKNHFSSTEIYNLDFEDFLNRIALKSEDFIFLDPPYDTDFNNYAKSSFDKLDQERLANYLINKCPAKFMLIIKNTEFIHNLYSQKGLYVGNFEKKYMVSFKNRNDRDCEHLIISNYPLKQGHEDINDIDSPKQLQYA